MISIGTLKITSVLKCKLPVSLSLKIISKEVTFCHNERKQTLFPLIKRGKSLRMVIIKLKV